MARRTLGERDTRTLFKLGNGSYALTIPIEHIRELKWQEKQKLTVVLEGRGKLVIKDWKSPRQKRSGK